MKYFFTEPVIEALNTTFIYLYIIDPIIRFMKIYKNNITVNKNYFLVIVLLISSYTFAQKPILLEDFSFKIGEKYKRIKSLNTYHVAIGNRLASIKKGRNSMTIQRYSLDNLKEDVKKRQVVDDKGNFETVIKLGEKAVAFYSINDKAYAQKISLTGIVIEKPIQLINDRENVNRDFGFKSTYGFDAGGRINKFAFKKSTDEKNLLILYRIKTESDKKDKIGIAVYSNTLNLLWKKKVTLPYPSNRIQNEDFAIGNDGNFYMTASIFNVESKNKNKLKETYHTEVFKITKNDTEIIKSKIGISGKAITDAVIETGPLGKVTISGLYANTENKSETSGVFSTELSDNGLVNQITKSDIPIETLQDLALKREERINEGTQKENDKKDLENLRINAVAFNNDGSIVLMAEQRYVESFTTSSSSGSRTTYRYFYRDIFTFKLATDNTIAWMHKLPKNQFGTVSKRSMSYFNLMNGGKHYLFFIDDFTNLKRSFNETPTRYFDGKKEFIYLTSYVIDDSTGEATKEAILTGSDIRNSRLDVLELTKTVILPNKTMIMEAYDGKKSNLLLKISLVK
ncbi:hypothetical protein [Aquimarina longa]|uniref:hypothetical protein n=1 Tax=Aquimarina longa TaxID=1080221 RepID=UPI0007810B26|nr:hypothetical protein [Aquimarina longa]